MGRGEYPAQGPPFDPRAKLDGEAGTIQNRSVQLLSGTKQLVEPHAQAVVQQTFKTVDLVHDPETQLTLRFGQIRGRRPATAILPLRGR